MSDGEALLRAILEHPAEDTPRLMYADWLEDVNGGNDQDYAEYIRVEVEIAALCRLHRSGKATAADVKRQDALFERDTELAQSVYPRRVHPVFNWLASLGVDYSGCVFNRGGFLAAILCPLAAFMQHAEALFRAHPIERVTLTDRAPGVNANTQAERWFGSESQHNLQFPDRIPMALYDILKAEATCAFAFEGFDPNANFAAGIAAPALSRACVAYGRSLAGLAPLPPVVSHAP